MSGKKPAKSFFDNMVKKIHKHKTLRHSLIAEIREDFTEVIHDQKQQIFVNSCINDLNKYGKGSTKLHWEDQPSWKAYVLNRLAALCFKLHWVEGQEIFKSHIDCKKC